MTPTDRARDDRVWKIRRVPDAEHFPYTIFGPETEWVRVVPESVLSACRAELEGSRSLAAEYERIFRDQADALERERDALRGRLEELERTGLAMVKETYDGHTLTPETRDAFEAALDNELSERSED